MIVYVRHFCKVTFIVLISFFLADSTFAQQQKLNAIILSAPVPVNIAGIPSVYYELLLTNPSTDTVHVERIEVGINSIKVLSLGGSGLRNRFPIRRYEKPKDGVLSPGDSSMLYMECALPGNNGNTRIDHHIRYSIPGTDKGDFMSLNIPTVKLSGKSIVIGSPLGAGNWAAVYDPSWERGHRRVFFNVNGKLHIPGRFAIDFILLDDQGRYVKGDENIVSDWYGYGADVLAVADGVVTTIRNDFTESKTLTDHPGYKSEQATGNYVSIRIDDHHVAFYEHLKPGSIKVEPGQTVKKGDIIASLGFTGQSTGPHLHFHIADQNSPLGAEGVPFVFETYTLLGNYPDFQVFGKEAWTPVPELKQKAILQRPGSNSVLKFKR